MPPITANSADASAPKPIFHDAVLNQLFAQQGYVVLNVVNLTILAELTQLFDQVAVRYQSGFAVTLLLPDAAHRQAMHEQVARLLAPTITHYFQDYRQLCGGFAVKKAQDEDSEMPLHQDISMLQPGGRPGLSFWLPLVPTDGQNGNLQVVPGSHRHYRHARAAGTPFPFLTQEEALRRHYLVPVPTRYGQAIVIDQALFHASPPNGSAAERPVATSVLLPAEAPAYYYFRRPDLEPTQLEAYVVPDEFFFAHRIGTPPTQGPAAAVFPEQVPAGDFARLPSLT